MKLAVVGATGMVGEIMLKVIEETNFPYTELILVASEKSVGKVIEFKGQKHTVVGLQTAVDMKADIAVFSAGGQTSLDWAPKFAAAGTTVIDNSSGMENRPPTKKLIVPEINANQLTKEDKIIANPNCSTIQMVLALAPLHKKYNIKRVVVSTYQSITGTGVKAVQQFENECAGIEGDMVYKYKINRNCIPQCDSFEPNGYTKEEMKLVKETKKILSDDSIKVTATAVRVPVVGGHSEAVNIEFTNDFDVNEVRTILSQTDGIVVQDNLEAFEYPMPRYSEGRNEVFVGRIRRDESQANTINMWIVADNLRKGAATNTIQIAQYLVANNLV